MLVQSSLPFPYWRRSESREIAFMKENYDTSLTSKYTQTSCETFSDSFQGICIVVLNYRIGVLFCSTLINHNCFIISWVKVAVMIKSPLNTMYKELNRCTITKIEEICLCA